MKKQKADNEIWESSFDDKKNIEAFKTSEGPKFVPVDKEDFQKGFHKFQPKDPKDIKIVELQTRIEKLEKEIKKIQKYLNSESKKTRSYRNNLNSQNIDQGAKSQNENKTK